MNALSVVHSFQRPSCSIFYQLTQKKPVKQIRLDWFIYRHAYKYLQQAYIYSYIYHMNTICHKVMDVL